MVTTLADVHVELTSHVAVLAGHGAAGTGSRAKHGMCCGKHTHGLSHVAVLAVDDAADALCLRDE